MRKKGKGKIIFRIQFMLLCLRAKICARKTYFKLHKFITPIFMKKVEMEISSQCDWEFLRLPVSVVNVMRLKKIFILLINDNPLNTQRVELSCHEFLESDAYAECCSLFRVLWASAVKIKETCSSFDWRWRKEKFQQNKELKVPWREQLWGN